VPVYKVPYIYLRRCIESCINQDYKNFEILLIDDGSPDDCGIICDEYALYNKCINVIHKENGGVSDARNCGISNSHGDYISFVDGDDYVSPDYLSTLYDLLKRYKTKICITDFYSYYGNVETFKDLGRIKERVYTGKDAVNEMFYQGAFDDSPWAKLYSKDLFNGIEYPCGIIYEDTCVTYRLMLKCDAVVFSSKKTYYYLLREDSYEGAPFSDFKLDSCFKTFKLMEEDNAIFAVLKSYKCKMVSLSFHLLLKAPQGYSRTEELWNRIKVNRLAIILDKKARIKTKIACIVSYGGISLLKSFFKLVDNRTEKKYKK